MQDATERDIWSDAPSLWLGFPTYFKCGVIAIAIIVAAVYVGAWPLLGILLLALIVARRALSIKSTRYRLTSQRLKIITGIVGRRIIEIELFRVRDLSLIQGPVQRLVGIGTVRAASSDRDAEDVFLRGVRDAVQVKENLRQHVMDARKQTGTRDIDVASTGR